MKVFKTYLGTFGIVCVIIGLMLPSNANGQTTFTANTISSNFGSPAGIYSDDIDMDGDNDVVAGSGVNGISLWINQGGDPITWAKQTIDSNSGVCLSVFIADIFRDNQPDIVAISTDRNQIIYYKNEGGDPTVWSKNIISSGIDQPHEIYVCDFDNDGNQDVFAAGMSDTGEVTWWHNDGGDPVQWTKQVISGNEPGARSVHVADIDGDGDNDVAGAIFITDEVVWGRNDGGNPISWTRFVADNTFDGSHRIQCEDMDNDGDFDLLGTAYMGAEIAIWRNDGGDPVSWTKISVDNAFGGAVIGIAEDINSDGFMDVFGTAQGTHSVAWYENKGTAELSFKKRDLGEFAGVWPAHVSDIDGDMDIDLLAGGFDANEIRWYENKQVGRFNNQVEINETPTNLGFFVPEEYDPDKKYKLIVALHICGDENEYSRYRDNLIPLCLELDAIMVAPDCHNSITNIDVPDPVYILDAIEYAKARFNIDEEYIYLTGGSCNGRTALKYGLEKIYDFRGVIPFNPYIPEWADGYYDFSSNMPVCFAAGTLDANYTKAQEAYDQIIEHQGRAGFVSIPGVGHDFYFAEFTEVMMECINFIDSLVANSTSVGSLDAESDIFKAYPNPYSNFLSIVLPQTLTGTVEISMFNIMGQEVYNKRFRNIDNHSSPLHLNFSDLEIPDGTIILQLKNQQRTLHEKLIRRRFN